MNDILVQIPGEVLASAKIPRSQWDAELKKQLALQLYRVGMVSGAGACRIAGVGKLEFQYLLGEAGICQQYGVEDFHEDQENLQAWQSSR